MTLIQISISILQSSKNFVFNPMYQLFAMPMHRHHNHHLETQIPKYYTDQVILWSADLWSHVSWTTHKSQTGKKGQNILGKKGKLIAEI